MTHLFVGWLCQVFLCLLIFFVVNLFPLVPPEWTKFMENRLREWKVVAALRVGDCHPADRYQRPGLLPTTPPIKAQSMGNNNK